VRSLRVLISGYFGFDNAGDEAVLEASVRWLQKLIPGIEIAVLSASPAHTQKRLPTVTAYDRFNALHVLRVIKQSDAVLSGGGGLLQDVTSFRSLMYYLAIMAVAQSLGKPLIIFAQGFGPVRTKTGRLLTRLILRHAQLITLRDIDSSRDLASLGISGGKVHVTADPAFLLEPAPAERGHEILKSLAIDGVNRERKPLVAVSLRPWPKHYEPGPMWTAPECYAEALDAIAEKTKARIVLVPMYPRQDSPVLDAVSKAMKTPAPIVDNVTDPKDTMALLGCCDLVIGMRLHAAVFAVSSGVPAIGISYDPKVERLFRDLRLPCINPQKNSPNSLEQVVTQFLSQDSPRAQRALGRSPSVKGDPVSIDGTDFAVAPDSNALDSRLKDLRNRAYENFTLVKDVLTGL
jgi:polysaccharide pyruvyl transferase CsaB